MGLWIFNSKKKKDSTNTESFLGGQVGAYLSKNIANTSNEAIGGMNLLRNEAERLINVSVDKKQGNLFEIIERTKFNMDAAKKGSSLRAVTTAELGMPHAQADILIKDGERTIKEIQAKSSEKSTNALKELFKKREKYVGMDKVINKEHVDNVNNKITQRIDKNNIYRDDYQEIKNTLSGETKAGDITSGGTTYKEVESAAQNANDYANKLELKQFKNEIRVSAKQAATAGVIIGGSISIIKNGVSVYRGEIDSEEMIKNTIVDATKTGIKSGATGGLGAGIRISAQKAGVNSLAKSNVATAVASGVIDIGVTVFNYAKGEITSEQAMEQIGEKGFSTMSSIYAGATAGLVFGPGGAVVGSIAGYIMATNVYQSCIEIFKYAKLKEEEAMKIVALYDEACEVLRKQRAEFEIRVEEKLSLNKRQFNKFFNSIDYGLKNNDHSACVVALSDFTEFFGQKLKLANFEEFDEYMKGDVPLKL